LNSKSRFSDRVENYAKYRPSYPAAALDFLRAHGALGTKSVVADIGSGTGIASALLLDAACVVHAVEPNEPMRLAAERLLGHRPGFRSVNGSAEATGLPADSVDLIVAAQAFHWFDTPAAAAEFRRILRPAGFVALLWNDRATAGSDFLAAYEELLVEFGNGYTPANGPLHEYENDAHLRALFGGAYERAEFRNGQTLDYEALLGRLLSSSYAPQPGEPKYLPMEAALRRLFERFQAGGTVSLNYETRVYLGRLPR
jgi:SAM-dependent methyltransferase